MNWGENKLSREEKVLTLNGRDCQILGMHLMNALYLYYDYNKLFIDFSFNTSLLGYSV